MSQFNLYLERVQENRNYQDLEVYDESAVSKFAAGLALIASLYGAGNLIKSYADNKISGIQASNTAGAFFSQDVDTSNTSYGYFSDLAKKLLEGEKIDVNKLKKDLQQKGLTANGIEKITSTVIEAENQPDLNKRYAVVKKYFSNEPLKRSLSATIEAITYLDNYPKSIDEHSYAKELLIRALRTYPNYKGVTELQIKKHSDYENLKSFAKTMLKEYQKRIDGMYEINL